MPANLTTSDVGTITGSSAVCGGTAYGNQVSFTTQDFIMPTVTTSSTEATSCLTATSGGNVTRAGDYTVKDRGVCWGTSSNPTTSDSKTTEGSGTGSFTSLINSLEENTTYYIRAYATNSDGKTS